MPFVLIYKVAWPTYVAARLVVNVNFLGMPNLLAAKEVVPELIQHGAKPDAIVNAVRVLVENSTARDEMISNFGAVINKLGGTGASERAACAILDELKEGDLQMVPAVCRLRNATASEGKPPLLGK
jgi:lipid-A-disaccharide synthase